MIISKTPFRISFFGGGTDYPVWYENHGGAVLSTTIDKYCYINVRYLPPFFEHRHRIVYSNIENVKHVYEIKHPVVRALLEYYKIDRGVEVHHDADLPARSGLGSSSAFTVGMINSLVALKGGIISRTKLAKEAIYIEREILKENVGSQDQISSASGGFNKIVFHTDHNFRVEPITLRKERIDELQNCLMLVFTGLSRYASEIAAEQIKNTNKKKKELAAMRQLVDHAVDMLNGKDPIMEFGKLLHESWNLKRKISKRISSPSIDNLYESVMKHGASGGKLLGAGGGGFMLFFVLPENRKKVKEALKELLEVKFCFENDGSQIIYYAPQDM
ncbi:MAG: kinase [Omnitrophica bacterium RIFCSPLOWO2_12_FULL_44_17]|uniref:Kinase n=1 Tax=Candidatus Danuiimicrobium aquiferis TaxID=1801832 RepID=A0A1G1KQF0_9BACT|nr:MAG: kinase [Omnitrophica bacterium RIFCSPHIGHO2_02_FULL_45_28]OGW92544.1 MAG: kinase [Omnitrophica bacterium RIFCSPHIGHO2_12_FULL_44_12]OGW95055.1 MAG: kinase [Omnitrophica bacterium RIFCSPLOWO2_12_FULL_44_17]OGX02975.1 MAG: kinase [Omnitrophica bacterium RIFCSPLOWO2_02_FULL_44_11]